MDYAKEIAELKKITSVSSESFRNIDQYQREFKLELTLKRNQVSQLKNELNNANLKIFDLTKQLESTKSTLKETDFNLKLVLKKSSILEEKMKEMGESYMKTKLKEEMRVTEMKVLNENLQKMAFANHKLTAEVNELNDKLKFYSTFQNELDNRQVKINETLAKIREDTAKLEEERSIIIQLEKQLKCCEEFRNWSNTLTVDNKKLMKENADLESLLIENSAKAEKLTDLIRNHKHVNMYEQNIITKIKFLQWENRFKDLQQQTTSTDCVIQMLTDALDKETETNAKLIQKNEEYETRIEEMEKQLSTLNIQVKLKNECCEVVDID